MMAQFHSWVVIGMLLCPGELSRAENVEILKTVLGNHLVTSVVRNEVGNSL